MNRNSRLAVVLMVTLVVVAFGAGRATAGDDRPIKLFLNDKELEPDVPPVMINDRVLVPVRIVSENLGCEATWDEENWAVKLYTEDYQPVQAPTASSGILANLTQAQIDEAVQIGVQNKGFNWVPYCRTGGESPYNVSATLLTEYSSFVQMGEELKTGEQDIEDNRSLMKGHLVVVASVNGDSVDFPAACHGVLMQGWKVIQAEVESKPTLAETSAYWPNKPAYRATMSFLFSIDELDLSSGTKFDFVLSLPNGARPGVVFDAAYLK